MEIIPGESQTQQKSCINESYSLHWKARRRPDPASPLSRLKSNCISRLIRRIGEGLDCIFIYGFVPRTSLEETIRIRAAQVAAKRLAQASHTMSLEGHALSSKENREILSDMTEDLIEKLPTDLWDD